MSFIASYYDRYRDKVMVWEKTEAGNRILVEHKAPYFFYVPDPAGEFLSLSNTPLTKCVFNSKSEYEEACYSYPTRFESDISPQEKVMMTYFGKSLPKLTIGFIDIEVDYDPKIGFPRPKNPYAPINAITIYHSAIATYFTLAVPPPEWTGTLPSEMIDDGYFLCANERELLEQFLILIEDVDVLSGWNSEFFDLPYIGKRIELLFGQAALKRLAFEGGVTPRWTERERFKNSTEKEIVLDISSRVHLDYMLLFKKFNLGGRQSYSLSAIGTEEVNEDKVHYDGTLYDLYHNDFIKFMVYNRRDVTLIVKIDQKFKYIELANNMVHEGTVNFNSIFGSVALIDTSIINFCHHKLQRIVFDRPHKPGYQVEGAIVMTPKVGLHKWIASCDINSLYPSTYRSINLSPEKIVGQLSTYEEGWQVLYEANIAPDDDLKQIKSVTLIPEGAEDETITMSAREMIDFLRENKFACSAYGTILDQSSGEGLIPAVLTYWFNERKKLQGLKKQHAKAADELIKSGKAKTDPEVIQELALAEYYDMLQGVKKVLLNSSYGATLNEYCRFHDPRLGASTTGSGRQVTTHMINTTSKLLIGDNAPKLVKHVATVKNEVKNEYTVDIPTGLGPLYSDTDSVAGDTSVMINGIRDTIESHFQSLCSVGCAHDEENGKQFIWLNDCISPGMHGDVQMKGIYRHRTSKRRFKIILASGKSVIVTEDHSVMVERDGNLIEVKPLEIDTVTDICISIG